MDNGIANREKRFHSANRKPSLLTKREGGGGGRAFGGTQRPVVLPGSMGQ